MGRGNACVRGIYEGLYYIDYDHFYYEEVDEEDNETGEKVFSDSLLEECILEIKRKIKALTTFKDADRWSGREEHVVLENGLFDIIIEDNEWSFAIKLVQQDDDSKLNLQKKHHQLYLNIIRDVLFEQFNMIGIYGGPWTSGQIERPENFEGRKI